MAPRVRNQLPKAGGISLKADHFREILERKPAIGFFEIHAENYMVAGGPLHHYLERIRADYPLSIHGVGLSLAGADPLDRDHLDRLARLLHRYEPASFSEHLAWSRHGEVFLNDLLPVAYHPATLMHTCDRIDEVQEYLGRRLLLENPATYLEFSDSIIEEAEFIAEITRRTGCGLLLDLSNAYVSCMNHGRDLSVYLQALPLSAVEEIHLAGFSEDSEAVTERVLMDSHGSPVSEVVWSVYADILERTGPVATLIERDNHIPALSVLHAEAQRADALLSQTVARQGLHA